jgi:hypothetical protein
VPRATQDAPLFPASAAPRGFFKHTLHEVSHISEFLLSKLAGHVQVIRVVVAHELLKRPLLREEHVPGRRPQRNARGGAREETGVRGSAERLTSTDPRVKMVAPPLLVAPWHGVQGVAARNGTASRLTRQHGMRGLAWLHGLPAARLPRAASGCLSGSYGAQRRREPRWPAPRTKSPVLVLPDVHVRLDFGPVLRVLGRPLPKSAPATSH